jgi:DNA-binding beta-propeller fold protein YncE
VEGTGGLTEPGGTVTYRTRLFSWNDRPIPGGRITHTLPASFSYVPNSTHVSVGGWPISTADPILDQTSLTWGPFRVPAAGHTAHNPYGVHTFVQDLCVPEFIDIQLDQALQMVGSGGYVTQLFYRITSQTTAPDPCVTYFVNSAYDHNLTPILRLQGTLNPNGYWDKPDPGPRGDYAAIAAAFARYVAGLPRRDTHPLYIAIWNEPDLWIEWSRVPNASEYGRFFVAVSKAIRGLNDPRIRILNGAVTPTNTAFIRKMLAVPGFVNAFDAWASHCYPYNHPPAYNIHDRTARYTNATIDCYLVERDTIVRYGGRSGFKFVLTETGHGLGDNVYGFEGYSSINETNRASYAAAAFSRYWRTWPELIAATPFELGDPWSGWEKFDWIDYTVNTSPVRFSFTPHLQYTTVSALDKPRGKTVPHSIEITFQARVAPEVSPGIYGSNLSATAGAATAVRNRTAGVRVAPHVGRLYMPTISSQTQPQPREGTWYQEELPAVPAQGLADVGEMSADTDGAIVPTHLLAGQTTPSQDAGHPVQQPTLIPVAPDVDVLLPDIGAASAVGLPESAERVFAATTDGSLVVVNLDDRREEQRLDLGGRAHALAAGPRNGTVYALLDTGQAVLADTGARKLVGRTQLTKHSTGVAFDPLTGTVLVAEAGSGSLLRFSADLETLVETQRLADLPGQVLLDAASRRLVVTQPGAQQLSLLDADTLQSVAHARLVRGPLIAAVLDIPRQRVYVLSALTPQYRAISIFRADDLSPVALVAGTLAVPLRQATALALLGSNQLLVPEGDLLYRISVDDFTVTTIARLSQSAEGGRLAADPATDRALWTAAEGIWVYP